VPVVPSNDLRTFAVQIPHSGQSGRVKRGAFAIVRRTFVLP
jgi:hypothetical protein